MHMRSLSQHRPAPAKSLFWMLSVKSYVTTGGRKILPLEGLLLTYSTCTKGPLASQISGYIVGNGVRCPGQRVVLREDSGR